MIALTTDTVARFSNVGRRLALLSAGNLPSSDNVGSSDGKPAATADKLNFRVSRGGVHARTASVLARVGTEDNCICAAHERRQTRCCEPRPAIDPHQNSPKAARQSLLRSALDPPPPACESILHDRLAEGQLEVRPSQPRATPPWASASSVVRGLLLLHSQSPHRRPLPPTHRDVSPKRV